MEELLKISDDAKITIRKTPYHAHGPGEEPLIWYQVILSWGFNGPTNSFFETFGPTIDECIDKLKTNIKNNRLI